MNKAIKTNYVVCFKPVPRESQQTSDEDEVVMRLSDITYMYVQHGSCYISAGGRFDYQVKVADYDRIKKLFIELWNEIGVKL